MTKFCNITSYQLRFISFPIKKIDFELNIRSMCENFYIGEWKMTKYKSILLIMVIFAGILHAKPAHEKISLGMSLNNFNALNLGAFLPNQKRRTALTNYGLVFLDSSATKRYFDLKDRIWGGVMVEMKNNSISGFTLLGTETIHYSELQDIFSHLLSQHGVTFSLSHYQALSKKGYSITWHNQDELVSLNITFDKNQKCKVSLKKNITDEPAPAQSLEPKAIAALQPILGKDFHKLEPFQVASGESKNGLENQLNDLLN